MAVTSIWSIKGRVDSMIRYVANKEKTVDTDMAASLHKIKNVVQYTTDEIKTEQKEYVSCINCQLDHAIDQFISTKERWGKLGGRACYHGYQSFREGEVTAQEAHEIGVALAKELWGDRFEVVVATHCNTGIYHNHFVINSVSFADGYKYYCSKADQQQMRDVSDRLCREARLSVIDNPQGKKKHYAAYKAEQNGKPTLHGNARDAIDRAIAASVTKAEFLRLMDQMGYSFKTRKKNGELLAHPSVVPHGLSHGYRLDTLGKNYTLEAIERRILANYTRKNPFPDAYVRRRVYYGPFPVKGDLKTVPKITGLRALYFRYCYELHILRKYPTSVKRVSLYLQQDLIKLDSYIAQMDLLARGKIETQGQLTAYKENTESRLSQLDSHRNELRNEQRRAGRAGDDTAVESLKTRISAISTQMKALRKEVALCSKIEEHSQQVSVNLAQLKHQQEIERKETERNEHRSRRSRTDC